MPYLRGLAENMVDAVQADPTSIADDLLRENILEINSLIDNYLSQEYIDGRLQKLKASAKEQVFKISLFVGNFLCHIEVIISCNFRDKK